MVKPALGVLLAITVLLTGCTRGQADSRTIGRSEVPASGGANPAPDPPLRLTANGAGSTAIDLAPSDILQNATTVVENTSGSGLRIVSVEPIASHGVEVLGSYLVHQGDDSPVVNGVLYGPVDDGPHSEGSNWFEPIPGAVVPPTNVGDSSSTGGMFLLVVEMRLTKGWQAGSVAGLRVRYETGMRTVTTEVRAGSVLCRSEHDQAGDVVVDGSGPVCRREQERLERAKRRIR